MTVGMDSRLATIHNTIINTHALYREFFQHDINKYGFDREPGTGPMVDQELDDQELDDQELDDQEPGTEQMVDPGLD